jgi:hypothetical protein
MNQSRFATILSTLVPQDRSGESHVVGSCRKEAVEGLTMFMFEHNGTNLETPLS